MTFQLCTNPLKSWRAYYGHTDIALLYVRERNHLIVCMQLFGLQCNGAVYVVISR